LCRAGGEGGGERGGGGGGDRRKWGKRELERIGGCCGGYIGWVEGGGLWENGLLGRERAREQGGLGLRWWKELDILHH